MLIDTDIKSQWLMLLFSGTDVKTCLDVVSLFYFILIVVGKLFIFTDRTFICTDVVMQRLHLFIYS